MRLLDKVAIITGGARGIGRVTAERFATEGARVVCADLDQALAEEVAKQIVENGGTAFAISVDVADRASVDALVEATLEQYYSIDILVNNAGILMDNRLVKMSSKSFDQVIDVNLKGVFNCTQAVVPHMLEKGSGSIISTSSVVATFGNFGQTNYVASKAGVVGMTKVWARELGRKGIRVNAVAPGFVETRMTEGIPDKVVEKLLEKVPMGRFGKPHEIANAFVWLASDESSYVTGHVLAVDGGTVL